MASLARLADEKGQLESRRDGALTALATRAGVAIPDLRSVRLTGWADEVRPAVIGELACVTFLAEQVATLAAELDELRAELRASKKGASR